MSLTGLLKKPKYNQAFTKRIKFPEFDASQFPIRIPRRVNPREAALMGTALDYGMRFAFEKKYGAVRSGMLIAEWGLHARIPMSEDTKREIKKTIDFSLAVIKGSVGATKEFAYECYQLANLDNISRRGIIPGMPCNPTEDNINELRVLIQKAMQVWPAPEEYCLLNPTFGKASNLTGGADCDVVQDGCIYDMKCVNQLDIREPFKQLVGYYVLSLIGGIDGADHWFPTNYIPIHSVSIYFARHLIHLRMNIEDLITPEHVQELKDMLLGLEQEDDNDELLLMLGRSGDPSEYGDN